MIIGILKSNRGLVRAKLVNETENWPKLVELCCKAKGGCGYGFLGMRFINLSDALLWNGTNWIDGTLFKE